MRKWRTTLLGLIAVLGATMTGCWQETKPPENASPSFRGVTVKVGAIDEAGLLAGVTAHGGEWKASREGAIAIREQPVTLGTATEVDVLLFPGDRLGDLIDADLLAAIPNEAVMPPAREATVPGEPSRSEETAGETKPAEDPYDFMGVAAPYRDQVTRYGNERMALPYGGSALVLVYRRDAFEREANRTAAADKGIKLESPKTWDQLDALAQILPGPRLGRRRAGRPRHLPRAGRRRRGARQRDVPGPVRQPGSASGPVLLPVRLRQDGPADRRGPLRRGPGRIDRTEGRRPAEGGDVRRRGGRVRHSGPGRSRC